MPLVLGIVELWSWLVRPEVVPLIGAFCVVITAVLLRLLATSGKSRISSLSHALLAATIWLVLVALIGFFGAWGRDKGDGSEGNGGHGSPATMARSSDEHMPSSSSILVGDASGKTVVHGNVEPLHFNGASVIITFVPSPANPMLAQEFACDLLYPKGEGQAAKVEIRARNMDEFVSRLGWELRKALESQPSVQPTIRIQPVPFPGLNVVKRVRETVQRWVPNAIIILHSKEES